MTRSTSSPHRPVRRSATALVAAAVAGTLFAPSASAATAAARPWDFNGDGVPDSAIGVPGENERAGGIVVFRGTSTGLSTSTAQRFSQDSTGVPGVAQAGDAFGSTLASGDFDKDGFADLAVGVPGEDTPTDEAVGAVSVLYGSATGLSGKEAHGLGRPDAVLGEVDPEEDALGQRLVAADFDGDGDSDLGVAVTSGRNGVLIYRGRSAGLATLPSQAVGPGYGLPENLGSPPVGPLAAGDLDGNGTPDLVIGYQEHDQARGAVAVAYTAEGSGFVFEGVDAPAPQVWTEDSAGVKGVAADLDAFGAAVGIGDVGGDGRKDLVVTVLQQPTSEDGATGALHVLRGGADGVTADGDQYLTYESVFSSSSQWWGGALGAALGVGDFDGDDVADVAVTYGAYRHDRFGAVQVLYGDRGGLGSQRKRSFKQSTAGIAGTTSRPDYWGESLRVRNVGKTRRPDLIVADPYQKIDGGAAGGMVNILWAGHRGLQNHRATSVTQERAGIPGSSEEGDLFGLGL